jgi:hypothetical protein
LEEKGMKPIEWRAVLGIMLLVFGVLFLLQSFDVLPEGGWLWSVPFALGGIAFLVVLSRGKAFWWAAIPGVILLFLGITIALGELAPGFSEQMGGSIFLLGIAIAFLIVYLMNNHFWWAIIPMGVLATLSLVAALEQVSTFEGGAVFFLGLAVTFGLVAVLPSGGARMRWPWIPALVLLVLGALVSIGAEGMMVYVLPAALILVGLYLLSAAFLRR